MAPSPSSGLCLTVSSSERPFLPLLLKTANSCTLTASPPLPRSIFLSYTHQNPTRFNCLPSQSICSRRAGIFVCFVHCCIPCAQIRARDRADTGIQYLMKEWLTPLFSSPHWPGRALSGLNRPLPSLALSDLGVPQNAKIMTPGLAANPSLCLVHSTCYSSQLPLPAPASSNSVITGLIR